MCLIYDSGFSMVKDLLAMFIIINLSVDLIRSYIFHINHFSM
jgi:hypothetical protein